jgi:hypothetical protein
MLFPPKPQADAATTTAAATVIAAVRIRCLAIGFSSTISGGYCHIVDVAAPAAPRRL